MKIGEVWRYKSWLIKLLDDNIHLYTEGYTPATDSVRIKIVEIDGEEVWFTDVNSGKNKHSIHRETFIQIFEKEYK
jgi:hypothetical protein